MKAEDIRKLLGGYATGTLTEEERKVLFEAALSDQDLFNELAGEQALKELLEDPGARRQLLNALDEEQPLPQRLKGWFGRPVSWAMAGGLAAVVLLVAVLVRTTTPPARPEPTLIAKREAAPISETERLTPLPLAAPAQKAVPKPKAFSPPSPAPREKLVVAEVRQEIRPTLAKPESPVAAPMAAGYEVKEKAFRPDIAGQPPPIRYRILRGDAQGNYAEVEPQTAFQSSDLIRVAFEPSESGQLQVTSTGAGGSSKVVFNNSVEKGATYSLDVPPGEQKFAAVFSRQLPPRAGAQVGMVAISAVEPAPVVIEIPIRRQPAP
jgi:hypothetical protein